MPVLAMEGTSMGGACSAMTRSTSHTAQASGLIRFHAEVADGEPMHKKIEMSDVMSLK